MTELEKMLSKIHTKTAEKMLEMLESGEELTPAMLNSITKFLKDNDVTASIEPGTPHAALKEEFSRLDLRSVGLPEFLENRNELDKANEG